VQLERIGDERPHVGAVGRRQALQERQQPQQLRVALVVVPALDRDAVGQLEAERLRARPPGVALRAAAPGARRTRTTQAQTCPAAAPRRRKRRAGRAF